MDSLNPGHSAPRTHPFEFTGNAVEYFKIWIVNVFLSIVTLGIYSAWAKVRTKRYFYGNTLLDGSPFEYLADPVGILKGRLIAFAVLGFYVVSVNFMPLLEPVFLIAFLIILPWLVVRALAFNARNSAYRNIRFDFDSTYLEAAKVFFLFGLLTLVTLGLAYPYFVYRLNRFRVENAAFGSTRFDFDVGCGAFYKVYLKALGLVVLAVVAFVVLGSFFGLDSNAPVDPQAMASPAAMLMLLVPMLLVLPFYFYIGVYIGTTIANLVMDRVRPGRHQLASNLKTSVMCWLYFSNFVGILLSLGLLIPWARIRVARYRAECLQLEAHGSLDDFVAGEARNVRATGEEMSDMLDLDFAV